MQRNFWLRIGLIQSVLAAAAWAGTIGRVVTLGGHGSDLALDEARGVVYVANYTANRIDVVGTADLSRRPSMNVAAQPGSLALSPNGRYLLVTHYANWAPPGTPFAGLTLIRLDSGARQTFVLPSPPLGVAFTSDNRALVVTTTEFLRFDPAISGLVVLTTIQELAARTLPVPPANFPPQIVTVSMAASRDGEWIYGLTDTLDFRYERRRGLLSASGYTSTPPQGPRVVSVSADGAIYASGWGLFDREGTLIAQFPEPLGYLNIGSHAIDSARNLIYAQVPREAGEPPVLTVADADNLTVRERFHLPENLAGKSVLSSDGSTMYSISDSGLMALPVGAWEAQPRIVLTSEELLFQASFCDRKVETQRMGIDNPGGAPLWFSITGTVPGVTVTPSSGLTPASVDVRVDPNAFSNRTGSVEVWLQVNSTPAANVTPKFRVLVNLREPDLRGTPIHVPGKLVDILADPVRDRFYVLRQDRNQVLVYSGSDYSLIATLRTGNTPTQMAFTFDRRYLLVGNDNSQIANVFDLETFEKAAPIRFPGGHYPRSLAASGGAILGASRVAGPIHTIDRVDFFTRTAVELPALGVYENNIHENTVLVAAGNGASILAAQADGNLWLYDANADTFTISRKDFESLGGAYAASNYDWYFVDNMLLNGSLVPVAAFEKGGATSSGFASVDQSGFWTTLLSAEAPGVIQRVDTTLGAALQPTRMADSPLAGTEGAVFTRTLAALASRTALVSLTTGGVTVLAWNYDAGVAPPRIDYVSNAADYRQAVAPGGLITLFGSRLSPVNLATSEMPLPRALGDSCLIVNGAPAPMLFVSPSQINAQLPFAAEGSVTLTLHTPGGVSDAVRLAVLPAAPSVFHSGVAGPRTDVPTIFRAANFGLVTSSNPIHRGDAIVIFLTGMGPVWPAVETGAPAPSDPPAAALLPVEVTLDGFVLPVFYAGLTPGLAGVYRINALVPDSTPTGLALPLTISQGGESTSIPVRVVQ